MHPERQKATQISHSKECCHLKEDIGDALWKN